jgi:hypothetical protein
VLFRSFGFEAEADLTRAGWIYRPGLRKFIDAPFSIVVQGRRFPDQVIVSNAEFRFPPLLLIANASQTLSTGAREWSAAARIASLEEFARSRGGLAGLSPSGLLTVSGKGKRSAAGTSEEWHADVDLGNAGFQLPGQGIELRGLNGHIEAGPRSIAFLPVVGLFNGQGFSLRGSVARGAATRGQIGIRMAYLDVDSLLSGRDGTGTSGKGAVAARGRLPAAVDKCSSVSARALVEIDAGKAGGIAFRSLRCDTAYEKGVITVDSARAEFLGGTATLSGRIAASGPSPGFRVKVAANGVRAGELLSKKTSLGDYLSGKAAFSAEISGELKDFDAFARTAAGSGFVRMTDGRIKGIDLLKSALVLAGLSAGPGELGRAHV